MRFSGGWVKLYRNIDHSCIGSDLIAYGLYVRLMCWANIQDSEALQGGTKIIVKRGQILTSHHELSSAFKISKSAVQRRLFLLKRENFIDVKVTRRGTMITICNYDELQKSGSQGESQMNHSWVDPDQRIEELRIKNKEIIHNTGEGVPPQTAKAVSKVNTFISRYCELYKQKYGTNPVINGKASGIAKRVVKELGEQRALALMEKYLLIEDSWFKTKSHDLQTFEGSLNRIEAHQEKISLVQEWINAGTK